jgi:hypothetical protein
MHELVPIVLFISMFACIFGVYYIRSRENMAMIEKGFNPRTGKTVLQPFMSLKFGLLLTGAGLGLFIAYLLDMNVFHRMNTDPLYPSLIGVGGGLGLIISYLVEKKYYVKNKGE